MSEVSTSMTESFSERGVCMSLTAMSSYRRMRDVAISSCCFRLCALSALKSTCACWRSRREALPML